jgi:hypothetical protein
MEIEPNINSWLDILMKYSSRKTSLKKLLNMPANDFPISICLHLTSNALNQYTQSVDAYLKQLYMKKLWDPRLGTTREQYHLYMLEIELTNRLYTLEFEMADRKIGLLPYCLQDFTTNCKAAPKGFDYQCRHCSDNCFQNKVSSILEEHGIEPYIWRGSDFKRLAIDALKDNKRFAVFGIACIPELTWGMRKCRKNQIPVLGLPLNANRCIRWFGEFLLNSVDLLELKNLLHD